MRTYLLIAALMLAAAPALAQTKAPAAKPAAKGPAAKAAPKPAPKPATAPREAFDAHDPGDLVKLLAGMGATAEIAKTKAEGSVSLNISTPGGAFGAQFVGCDAEGKACRMLAFSTGFERRGATLAQLNIFNRTEIACRGFLTDDGKSNVMYAALLTQRLTAEEMRQHIGVWQGCLSTFGQFTADPVRFIAGRP
jgi:hypothetical protein